MQKLQKLQIKCKFNMNITKVECPNYDQEWGCSNQKELTDLTWQGPTLNEVVLQ